MSTETTNTTDIRALAAAVRDGGKLTPEQRECLAGPLQSVALAATLAPRAERHYPAGQRRRRAGLPDRELGARGGRLRRAAGGIGHAR